MLMVDVAKCPLCEVVCYCTGTNGTEISVHGHALYRIAGYLLLNDTVRTFRNVCYIASVHH